MEHGPITASEAAEIATEDASVAYLRRAYERIRLAAIGRRREARAFDDIERDPDPEALNRAIETLRRDGFTVKWERNPEQSSGHWAVSW
jgi:hypothetical protein